MTDRKIRLVRVIFLLISSMAVASNESIMKGSLTLNGKTTELKYGYAWLEPDSFGNQDDFVLKLLFSEKPQAEPQNDTKQIPVALVLATQLTSPDSVRYGINLIQDNGSTSMLSAGDRLVISSFTLTNVAGRIYHNLPDSFWNIEFSLPLLSSKNAVKPRAALLGDPLPADGGLQLKTCRSYLTALKSGDPGTIRKYTTHEFGINFSRPEMRIQLQTVKNTVRDDVYLLNGLSNGNIATIFVKPSASSKDSEVGIIKLGFVNNEWKVSADIFTKFH